MTLITGIYCIENIKNKKKYIGQASDIIKRFYYHKYKLRINKGTCHLQQAWNKYGEENFIFYILEQCSMYEMNEREKFYINLYKSYDNKFGYNLTSGGEREGGYFHREETKEKISQSEMNKIVSQETREKISISQRGKKQSVEHKKKISSSLVGNKRAARKHTTQENDNKSARMQGTKRKNSSSQYIGVCWNSHANKWMVKFKILKKYVYGGIYEIEIEAALAYNELIQEFLGWKSKLNVITQEQIDNLWRLD